MNYSTNYSMREPVPGEKVKVADINYNTEIIDGVMLDNRQISIDMYDDTSTYNTDDLAGHENSSGRIAVYRCLQDNTTGAWDDTKWVQTNLADEITDIRGNAGASDLGDLHDVEITTPTDGQALLYDPTSLKWHNSDLPDADVTKEASGNPIEFEDGADAPLVKCVTQITGSQDLHGQDKPWVGGSWKNKLPMTVSGIKALNTMGTWSGNTYNYRNVDLTILTDSDDNVIGIDATGTASANLTHFIIAQNVTFSEAIIFSCGFVSTWNRDGYVCEITDGTTVYTPSEISGVEIPSGTYTVRFAVKNSTSVNHQILLPMLRLSTETDPTFAPYSNICPIMAYTEGEIEVRGKNLLNVSGIDYTGNNVRIKWDESTQKLTKTGTANGNGWLFFDTIEISVPGTYTFSSDIYHIMSGSTDLGITYTFTVTDTPKTFNLGTWTTSGNQYNTSGYVQIERGTTPTTYEPYTSTTHTTTYPSAIYRGSEDCVKGEVVSEKKKITISSGIQLYGNYGVDNAPLFYVDIAEADIAPYSNTTITTNNRLISNMYSIISTSTEAGMKDFEFRTNNTTTAANRLYFRDSRFTTAEDFNTWIANNPIEIVYRVFTPTTSSVTPTNLPIKSLSGYNHIESSTGEMEIEYFPAKEQPLIDLIENTVEQYANVYSTDERAIGEWIDGNTLYRRTYEIEVQSPSAPYTQDISISGMVVVGIEKHYANYQYSGTWYYESGDQLYTNSSQYLSITQKDEAGTALAVSSNMGNGLDAIKICFSILYTKTSNRSLAKSAPQEETKEEQVEELKEEPEETKEEPVEEVKEEVKEEETKEEGEVNER